MLFMVLNYKLIQISNSIYLSFGITLNVLVGQKYLIIISFIDTCKSHYQGCNYLTSSFTLSRNSDRPYFCILVYLMLMDYINCCLVEYTGKRTIHHKSIILHQELKDRFYWPTINVLKQRDLNRAKPLSIILRHSLFRWEIVPNIKGHLAVL